MKPLLKDFLRGLAKHKGKFISVFFIILVGTAVFSGLRSSEGDMLLSADSYYDRTHLMDLRVVGTLGITQQDIDDLNALDVAAISVITCFSRPLCTPTSLAERQITISCCCGIPIRRMNSRRSWERRFCQKTTSTAWRLCPQRWSGQTKR